MKKIGKSYQRLHSGLIVLATFVLARVWDAHAMGEKKSQRIVGCMSDPSNVKSFEGCAVPFSATSAGQLGSEFGGNAGSRRSSGTAGSDPGSASRSTSPSQSGGSEFENLPGSVATSVTESSVEGPHEDSSRRSSPVFELGSSSSWSFGSRRSSLVISPRAEDSELEDGADLEAATEFKKFHLSVAESRVTAISQAPALLGSVVSGASHQKFPECTNGVVKHRSLHHESQEVHLKSVDDLDRFLQQASSMPVGNLTLAFDFDPKFLNSNKWREVAQLSKVSGVQFRVRLGASTLKGIASSMRKSGGGGKWKPVLDLRGQSIGSENLRFFQEAQRGGNQIIY